MIYDWLAIETHIGAIVWSFLVWEVWKINRKMSKINVNAYKLFNTADVSVFL